MHESASRYRSICEINNNNKKVDDVFVTKTRVAVIFEPGRSRPKPQWFTLDGRKVQITGINYYWEHVDGALVISHYSVNTDVAGLCELTCNKGDMSWDVICK